MKLTSTRLGLILLVVPIVVLLTLFFLELGDIRQCELVDQGHWNYLAGHCGDTPSPFVPWIVRSPWLVNGGLLVSVVGLGLCMLGLYRRRG
ncbi:MULTISPECIES: hypothetical protein [unclassified Halomonas]|uniref:hypothetical protein n=1 Tax=unclassified Halomonas TaxID=2609666 RepID=UPI000C9481A7|nr:MULTISPECIES: hypothetical protein [unclassified Halomonas]MBR9770873.1 hypothetical protein [Gammaproteobacteria bacterium]MAR72482.1 hypothetical protein [Halomonas sp.]MBR9877985.1 hypothetical protein [Gammaproteobacteria bacterium]MCJ8284330.1 hypothetical protein [Halomonas sp.]NQY69384.1 hypothetical protein [Halomonas sp.]|tara:strand:- start:1788 stop:2060 length:273 start_codon:yes stop_codon:yes gene_type:complete